ncbi:MAG TPA: flavodoxin domain-containing protein [Gaiellaceae bacterium]|nr:flavodoxin domain-containing protein [Gaiellaceae bacterium]
MNAAVVYESSFGNTRAVAETIAGELGARVYSVDDEPPELEGLDLLVVGAPTHVHGLSGARSRQAAHEQGAPGTPGIGAREWLERMPEAPGLAAAAFDTRPDKPAFLTGSAARGIAKRLQRHGCTLATRPESFFVEGTPGPLSAGEAARAAAWGKSLRR